MFWWTSRRQRPRASRHLPSRGDARRGPTPLPGVSSERHPARPRSPVRSEARACHHHTVPVHPSAIRRAAVAAAALALTLAPGSAVGPPPRRTRSTYASRWRTLPPSRSGPHRSSGPARCSRRTASRWTATTSSRSSVTATRSRVTASACAQGDVVKMTDVVKERKVKRREGAQGHRREVHDRAEAGRAQGRQHGSRRRPQDRRAADPAQRRAGEVARHHHEARPRAAPAARARRSRGLVRARRRRPQLGRARQLRVRRQPPRGQPGRLLRPLPVRHRHVAQRGRLRSPDRGLGRGADLPRQAALPAARPLARGPPAAACSERSGILPVHDGEADQGAQPPRVGRHGVRPRLRPCVDRPLRAPAVRQHLAGPGVAEHVPHERADRGP